MFVKSILHDSNEDGYNEWKVREFQQYVNSTKVSNINMQTEKISIEAEKF